MLTVRREVSAPIPTAFGSFELHLYTNDRDSKEHLALTRGQVLDGADVIVRVHSECFTGDVIGSRRCDCGPQLEMSMRTIANEGSGVVIYLRQEGRGIGLRDKLRAYNLQDRGYDTVEANWILGHSADERDYSVAAAMLSDLGVRSVRLLTNNPGKVEALRQSGIHVTARLPLVTEVTVDNADYLRAKASRLNHNFADGHNA